jgi:hypothetical protein
VCARAHLLGYRLPVTWPFLGAVGSGLTPTTPAAPIATQTSPLLLAQAQRAAAQRRRYPKKNLFFFVLFMILSIHNLTCLENVFFFYIQNNS